MSSPSKSTLLSVFTKSSTQPTFKKKPPTLPVSIRVTKEEKAILRKMAGSMAIAHYIRKCVFGDDAAPRAKRHEKKQPSPPAIDYVMLAQVLGNLGQSELATSMLALALAAKSGELEISDKVENKLDRACDDIQEMKHLLIVALGIKPQTGGDP